jgi:hypothetical protein
MGFAPFVEGGIADQGGFDDFRIAIAPFTWWQRVESGGVGNDHQRLMKGADQVLAARGVDACFATNARIDLGQQGGGELYEGQAAQCRGGGEAREVADDTAAQRDDGGVPVHFLLQQGFH